MLSPRQNSTQIIRPEESPDWYSEAWGDRLMPENEFLEFRLNGDLKAYDQIDADPYFGALIDERRSAPFRKSWKFEPASQKPADILATELIRAWVQRFDFDNVCGQLNNAIFTGRTIAELENWQESVFELRPKKKIVKKSFTVPGDVRAKDPSRLVFALAEPDPQFQYVNGFQARQLTRSSPFTGEPLPVNSVIIHSRGSQVGNPYGRGTYRRLWWLDCFKRQVMKIGIPTLEARALPYISYVKGEAISAAEIEQAKKALAHFYKLGWASFPEGITVSFLERFHQGRIQSIREFLDWYNGEAAICIVGQTLTSKTIDTADRGNTSVHYEIMQDIQKTDADLLSSTLRKFAFEPIVRINIPGAQAPNLYRDFEPPIDLGKQSEVDERLNRIGFRRTLESVKELYGENFEEIETQAPPDPGTQDQTLQQ